MTDNKREYVVYEDWVEVGRFAHLNDALLLQKVLAAMRAAGNIKNIVRVFEERGREMQVIEAEWESTCPIVGERKADREVLERLHELDLAVTKVAEQHGKLIEAVARVPW